LEGDTQQMRPVLSGKGWKKVREQDMGKRFQMVNLGLGGVSVSKP
jgi:hypothetical protein